MHARLGTGFASADLDRLAARLREFGALAAQAKDSHEILARARWAIGERLRREAGALAVTQLVALLREHQMSWPDPTRYRPNATPDEIERSRTRRLRDVREAFLAQDFERAADGVLGVVRNWRSDYPEQGTPLWEETVLEAVCGALRGRLLDVFVEVLRRDRDAILSQTEAAIGKEVEALHSVIAGGVDSIAQANQAVAGSLRAIDQVLADIAWEHVRSEVPEARGQSGG